MRGYSWRRLGLHQFSFLSCKMLDSCIFFSACNIKIEAYDDRALHRIPFSNFHLETKEKMDRFCQLSLFMLVSHLFYACFGGEWNPEMTSQCKLDPFFSIVVHEPKKRLTSSLSKGKTSEGKLQGQNLFRHNKQGSSESLFMPKKFFEVCGTSKRELRDAINILNFVLEIWCSWYEPVYNKTQFVTTNTNEKVTIQKPVLWRHPSSTLCVHFLSFYLRFHRQTSHVHNKAKLAFCNDCCMSAKRKSALRLKVFRVSHISVYPWIL